MLKYRLKNVVLIIAHARRVRTVMHSATPFRGGSAHASMNMQTSVKGRTSNQNLAHNSQHYFSKRLRQNQEMDHSLDSFILPLHPTRPHSKASQAHHCRVGRPTVVALATMQLSAGNKFKETTTNKKQSASTTEILFDFLKDYFICLQYCLLKNCFAPNEDVTIIFLIPVHKGINDIMCKRSIKATQLVFLSHLFCNKWTTQRHRKRQFLCLHHSYTAPTVLITVT